MQYANHRLLRGLPQAQALPHAFRQTYSYARVEGKCQRRAGIYFLSPKRTPYERDDSRDRVGWMSFAGDHCVHARALEVASARCDCSSSHRSIERVANSIHLHLVLDGWKSQSAPLLDETKGDMEVEDLLAAKSQQSVHPPTELDERFAPWL